ncbi:SOS response-associated peptidase [uncultured Serinicoccus sp.]|uniref:SOS response-associated peptidase n=1 Tax=uncultured Serinicoccus sp. TaxID=735514 RepID=UPI00262F2A83|nr:SOS response-associated peptidase [uncultured Serinicoccus sp.]
MCGRYAASAHPDELVEAYDVELDATGERSLSLLKNPQTPAPGEPDYNVAPSKQAPVVLTRAPRAATDRTSSADAAPAPVRQLRMLTWGLVPSWAKDPSVGARMINARQETLLEKPAYARAALARRALVPISGWYEWQASPVATDTRGRPRKQPFYVTRADDRPLALAGLYEFWRNPQAGPDGEDAWLVTYAVLTTAAEPGLDRIHERQPLALEPEQWADWLDPDLTDADDVRSMVAAAHVPGRFTAWPVSRAVGNAGSNGAGLVEPLPRTELVGVVDPASGEVIGG